MIAPTQLYRPILSHLSQHSNYVDKRHIKTLSLMASAALQSESLNLSAWEPYVQSRATQAQSYERRWSRFTGNPLIDIWAIYMPLVKDALAQWKDKPVFLALDTTMIDEELCMIHLSVVCCGRAIPLLWKTLKHESASVAFAEYLPLLRQAQWSLRRHSVMFLADRGFANHELVRWLQQSRWHYRLRIPHDTSIHTAPGAIFEVSKLLPYRGNAIGYQGVRLWEDGELESNLMMGNLDNADEPWAVITDEPSSLQTLWDYGKRFCCEELYLDSKSGVFDLEGNKIEEPEAIDRLYGVVAVALLYSTLQGMAVQLVGLRSEVDPHWKRGLSYLKIGIKWLKGVVNKGRKLFDIGRLLRHDPEPCFASKRAQQEYFEQRRFNRVRLIECLW
jgi:hypothetical protein